MKCEEIFVIHTYGHVQSLNESAYRPIQLTGSSLSFLKLGTSEGCNRWFVIEDPNYCFWLTTSTPSSTTARLILLGVFRWLFWISWNTLSDPWWAGLHETFKCLPVCLYIAPWSCLYIPSWSYYYMTSWSWKQIKYFVIFVIYWECMLV